VFKALLSPRYAEGTTLATESTLQLPLPDDNGKAMAIICQIGHLSNDLPQNLEPSTAVEVAALCDKYDCTATIKTVVARWIDLYRDEDSPEVNVQLLAAAALIKYATKVQSLAIKLVLHSTKLPSESAESAHVQDRIGQPLLGKCTSISSSVDIMLTHLR